MEDDHCVLFLYDLETVIKAPNGLRAHNGLVSTSYGPRSVFNVLNWRRIGRKSHGDAAQDLWANGLSATEVSIARNIRRYESTG